MEQNTSSQSASPENSTQSFDVAKMVLIPNTPFVSVEEDTEKYFLAMGNRRITKSVYKNHDEVVRKAFQVDYETVMQVALILIELTVKSECMNQLPIETKQEETGTTSEKV